MRISWKAAQMALYIVGSEVVTRVKTRYARRGLCAVFSQIWWSVKLSWSSLRMSWWEAWGDVVTVQEHELDEFGVGHCGVEDEVGRWVDQRGSGHAGRDGVEVEQMCDDPGI
ncbi:hypothetical protein B0H14DRAFT_2647344 [Mycena olivaceomarginata]|nr:hypothetical protein B0H14DRAFT_2647344 [Mycena olivaceomarginata]